MEVTTESLDWSSWNSITCYPRLSNQSFPFLLTLHPSFHFTSFIPVPRLGGGVRGKGKRRKGRRRAAPKLTSYAYSKKLSSSPSSLPSSFAALPPPSSSFLAFYLHPPQAIPAKGGWAWGGPKVEVGGRRGIVRKESKDGGI